MESTMIDESKPEDKGVAAALIERFEKWILPHALEIKAKVDRGEKLDDFDIDFLENELKDAEAIKPHMDRASSSTFQRTPVTSMNSTGLTR
jgi:hypothetical protein